MKWSFNPDGGLDADTRVKLSDGMSGVMRFAVRTLKSKIPPPAGTWNSCCHMATGEMKNAATYNHAMLWRNDGVMVQEFGMSAESASAIYHWAHEEGVSKTGVRAKHYMQKTIDHLDFILNSPAGQRFWDYWN